MTASHRSQASVPLNHRFMATPSPFTRVATTIWRGDLKSILAQSHRLQPTTVDVLRNGSSIGHS